MATALGYDTKTAVFFGRTAVRVKSSGSFLAFDQIPDPKKNHGSDDGANDLAVPL